MTVKFIDLNQQYQAIKSSVDRRIQGVLNHGQYIMGPEVFELEERLSQLASVNHCVSMASGTTALQVALMAIGIQPGDEIITTPFSFFGTAETAIMLGAKPIFVDINPQTYNIDAKLIERVITPRTKAIMPVNLYGQCADYDLINSIAKAYDLVVIEDAAQSFGATYKGRHSCGLATIGCTSFFPSKPLGCYGDGGACFTNDDELAYKMKSIRCHGEEGRYHHTRIGLNARLDTIQAAVLLAKLEVFSDELNRRQKIAKMYNDHLKGQFVIPYIESHNVSTYAQYTIRVNDRDSFRSALAESGIPTAVHYPKLLNRQLALKSTEAFNASYFEAQQAANSVLSLPFHPYLSEEIVRRLSDQLLDLYSRKGAHA